MHDGIDKLAELFPNCFFRENHLRRPLKIGIRDDIFTRQTGLRPGLIESTLSMYARSVSYWMTLKVGTPRIDLDGNVAGEVTIEDEQGAQRKIAKAARRAKAKAEEEKGIAARAAEPGARSTSVPATDGPPRLSLSGLKAAAQRRREARLVDAE
jgi:ProP effector